ncbi:hypothetical protein PR048_025141 [Dryococelus australis]|uniref:Ig-like domain-containing protein n=1 Tax=Dryococelus australis TaxID=614101 RepID=A0ABQ9GQI8_9NEOP|nr:hypothetical protein PR048_025141 [Dryococelus australis]
MKKKYSYQILHSKQIRPHKADSRKSEHLRSPLVDDRPIMNAVKYKVVSGVVWTNRKMVSSNTDTNRTGVLAVVDIDVATLVYWLRPAGACSWIKDMDSKLQLASLIASGCYHCQHCIQHHILLRIAICITDVFKPTASAASTSLEISFPHISSKLLLCPSCRVFYIDAITTVVFYVTEEFLFAAWDRIAIYKNLPIAMFVHVGYCRQGAVTFSEVDFKMAHFIVNCLYQLVQQTGIDSRISNMHRAVDSNLQITELAKFSCRYSKCGLSAWKNKRNSRVARCSCRVCYRLARRDLAENHVPAQVFVLAINVSGRGRRRKSWIRANSGRSELQQGYRNVESNREWTPPPHISPTQHTWALAKLDAVAPPTFRGFSFSLAAGVSRSPLQVARQAQLVGLSPRCRDASAGIGLLLLLTPEAVHEYEEGVVASPPRRSAGRDKSPAGFAKVSPRGSSPRPFRSLSSSSSGAFNASVWGIHELHTYAARMTRIYRPGNLDAWWGWRPEMRKVRRKAGRSPQPPGWSFRPGDVYLRSMQILARTLQLTPFDSSTPSASCCQRHTPSGASEVAKKLDHLCQSIVQEISDSRIHAKPNPREGCSIVLKDDISFACLSVAVSRIRTLCTVDRGSCSCLAAVRTNLTGVCTYAAARSQCLQHLCVASWHPSDAERCQSPLTYGATPVLWIVQAVFMGRCGRVVSSFASHQGEPGSIPCRVTPDFRMWESCRTMPLVSWFFRGSPVSPAPSFQHYSILTSSNTIGSQDLAVKSRSNLLTCC